MTEYITYHNSYTEFLVPNTSIKVVVHNDGSGYTEDMSNRDNGVVFSNGNTDTLCDKLREAEDMASNLKVKLGNKDMTIRGLNADMKGMERIVELQDKGIKSLNDKLTKMTLLENKQFQAKWDALTKLDDAMDSIEELRADNDKQAAYICKLVERFDKLMVAAKLTASMLDAFEEEDD